jgi:hypothetical protein
MANYKESKPTKIKAREKPGTKKRRRKKQNITIKLNLN